MIASRRWKAAGAVIAATVAIVAIVARLPLEQTMQRHMLIQIPLLFAAGVFLFPLTPGRDRSGSVRGWNAHGAAGLLLASGVLMTWMVPRALDTVVERLDIDMLKMTSLVAAGVCARYSWRAAGTIVRTFVIGNGAWMTATIGMLLLDAPDRLCTSYGASDQQETGITMIVLTIAASVAGAVYAVVMSSTANSRLKASAALER